MRATTWRMDGRRGVVWLVPASNGGAAARLGMSALGVAKIDDVGPKVPSPRLVKEVALGNLPGPQEGPVAGSKDERSELGGGPEDGGDGLCGVHNPLCWHGRVEGAGDHCPCEVMLDKPAHLVPCRGRFCEARTARVGLVTAVGLVERIGKDFDGCPDGGAHPTFWDLVIGVWWTQPQAVVGVHAQRSTITSGGCHVAEADSRIEPGTRSEMLRRTWIWHLSGSNG